MSADEQQTPPSRDSRAGECSAGNPSFAAIVLAALVVAVLAMLLRFPACYQSFWIDELHTAWTIWGPIHEVHPRAIAGNQSPFYFYGLWFWRQLLGDQEITLRLSSVLAVTLASGVLVVGIGRVTRQWMAGVAAGLLLAIEINSIFFGTELRPYAWVMLFSAIASVLFLEIFTHPNRHDAGWRWPALVASVLLAALTQPTSFGTLVVLPATVIACDFGRAGDQGRQIRRVDLVMILMTLVVCILLWHSTLAHSWSIKQQWASFATVDSFSKWLQIWDWSWLVVLPATLLIGSISANRWIGNKSLSLEHAACGLLIIASVVTFCFWLFSRYEWVPLWNRRYFIAVLPMFAAGFGVATSAVGKWIPNGPARMVVTGFVSLVWVVGLGWNQGTLRQLPNYPVNLAPRGEDWRGAVAWLNQHAAIDDLIYIDPGLIESQQRGTDSNVTLSDEYFELPVRGPYRCNSKVTAASELDVQPMHYLLRRSLKQLPAGLDPARYEIHRFGARVSVLFFTGN